MVVVYRIKRCVDCNYQALSQLEECNKCGGKLEIIASEIKQEVLHGNTNNVK